MRPVPPGEAVHRVSGLRGKARADQPRGHAADARAGGNGGVPAQRAVGHLGGAVDLGDRFVEHLVHHAAFRAEKAETSMVRVATASRTGWSWKMPRRAMPRASFSRIIAITTS